VSEKLPSASSAEDILGLEDCHVIAVEVPEWKRTVHIRMLPADEGTDLADRVKALGEGGQAARLALLSATIVDAAGNRLFTTEEQIQRLAKRSLGALVRLERASLHLNYEADPKNA
jgi:hypothetical protein